MLRRQAKWMALTDGIGLCPGAGLYILDAIRHGAMTMGDVATMATHFVRPSLAGVPVLDFLRFGLAGTGQPGPFEELEPTEVNARRIESRGGDR